MYRFLSRIVTWFVLLLLMMAGSTALLAQDEAEAFAAVGSGIVDPALQALAAASEAPITINSEVTGTSTGFTRFCTGEAALTTATRAINTEESNLCREDEIVPVELVLGHNILAVVGNPTDSFVICLTGDELTTAYAPSSAGEITNWNQVLTEGPEQPLIVLSPPDTTPEYALLDRVVEGDGIRADATISDEAANTITTISETPGAIGVVTLPQAMAASADIRILELDAAEIQGCQAPSAGAVEDDLYPAADKLYLYTTVASLENPAFGAFIDFVAGDAAAAVIESQGFTPVTEIAAAANRTAVETARSGELPVAVTSNSDFFISPGIAGQVGIAGAASGFGFAQDSQAGFTGLAPNVTVDISIEGMSAGFRRVCNGEVDIVLTTREITDEEAANCEANTITLLPYTVGTEAVVLVANASADYLTCLSTADLTTIWQASSGETITNWNQVNTDFPDQSMTLFAPNTGSTDTDLLLNAASGSSVAGRVDIELNDDALFRAAATANVEGALAYMNWQEYQDMLANNQAGIQLVAVDSGAGCVTPDLGTINDGSYALTRSLDLLVNRDQLAGLALQSWLWYAFSDENFRIFEDNHFVGLRLTDLQATRSALVNVFDEVLLEVNTPEVTAEPEATAEATAEVTATPSE